MNIFEKDGKTYRVEPDKVYGPGGADKDYLEGLRQDFPHSPIYPSWGEFLAGKAKEKGFQIKESDKPENEKDRYY